MEGHVLGTVGRQERSEARPCGSHAAVDAANDSDEAMVVGALNQALDIARFVALRCELHYLEAVRGHSPALASAAVEHAYEAQAHADGISRRIGELGGTPDAALDAPVPRLRPEWGGAHALVTGIGNLLADARAAIEGYRQVVASLAPSDPTTRELIEDILASEAKRAGVLDALLRRLSTRPQR